MEPAGMGLGCTWFGGSTWLRVGARGLGRWGAWGCVGFALEGYYRNQICIIAYGSNFWNLLRRWHVVPVWGSLFSFTVGFVFKKRKVSRIFYTHRFGFMELQ